MYFSTELNTYKKKIRFHKSSTAVLGGLNQVNHPVPEAVVGRKLCQQYSFLTSLRRNLKRK